MRPIAAALAMTMLIAACGTRDLGDEPIGMPMDQIFVSLEALTGSPDYRFTSSITGVGADDGNETITGDVQDRDHFHLTYEESGLEVLATFDGYWERRGGEWEPGDPRFERGQPEPPTSYLEAAIDVSGVVDEVAFVGNEVVGDGLETAHWRVEEADAYVDLWIDARDVVVKAEWFDTFVTRTWEMRDIGAGITVESPEL